MSFIGTMKTPGTRSPSASRPRRRVSLRTDTPPTAPWGGRPREKRRITRLPPARPTSSMIHGHRRQRNDGIVFLIWTRKEKAEIDVGCTLQTWRWIEPARRLMSHNAIRHHQRDRSCDHAGHATVRPRPEAQPPLGSASNALALTPMRRPSSSANGGNNARSPKSTCPPMPQPRRFGFIPCGLVTGRGSAALDHAFLANVRGSASATRRK